MDAFNDRLSQHARDTTKPALAHQCRGRELDTNEQAFADALIEIYGAGTHDFSQVIKELNARSIVAPRSGRTDWDETLFSQELEATNALLDAAYEADGYGA
ncbi:MAG: recombinase-like helix-turn-helix domain-containing protein [Pseudomonadota bacterium]